MKKTRLNPETLVVTSFDVDGGSHRKTQRTAWNYSGFRCTFETCQYGCTVVTCPEGCETNANGAC